MAQLILSLIAAAVTGQQRMVVLHNDEDGGAVIGCGDEYDRQCTVALPGGAQSTMHKVIFTERVQVIRSDAHQAQQAKGLEKRLAQAETALCALTPEPGRGCLGYHETTTHLTPLPALLFDVLRYLHLSLPLSTDLRDISTFDISTFGK